MLWGWENQGPNFPLISQELKTAKIYSFADLGSSENR
jgi:hypothetical protein